MDASELMKCYAAGERDFFYVNLRGANLRGANLNGASLYYLSGLNRKRGGAILSGANLSGANLSGVHLSKAHLSKADLHKANLHKANLSEADLFEANLSEANLSEAHLSEVNLGRANLNGADLRSAYLGGANLFNATLSGANLSEANLVGATLFDANLSNANLSNTNLNGTKLSGACFNQMTKFPEGFDLLKAGMRLVDPEIEEPTATQQRGDYYKNPDRIQNLLADQREEKHKNPPARPGQDKFRQKLLQAYNGKCAISECEIKEVLEAAHIIPWMGDHSHEVGNGLLLRADLHKLFDSFLLTIHPKTYKIIIAPSVINSYKTLSETETELKLRLPKEPASRPDEDVLKWHYNECQKRGWIKETE